MRCRAGRKLDLQSKLKSKEEKGIFIMEKSKRIIWSNRDLDIDDWREDYKEYLEANEMDGDPNDEQALYEWMVDTNAEYLSDERCNLDIQLSTEIFVIADLGLWDGRHLAYGEIKSGNIKDCLYLNHDYSTWYVDEKGDLILEDVHHDGTNYLRYRAYRPDATEEAINELKDKIYDGTVTEEDIQAVTYRLGDEIGKVYGWDMPEIA
jgi:hypothetical protein